MKKLILTLALVTMASSANAVPVGRWWEGFGQGNLEYGYYKDAARRNGILISCSDSSTNIDFTIAGQSPPAASIVNVTITGQNFQIPTDQSGMGETGSHVASDNFEAMWRAMRAGARMFVRFSDGRQLVLPLTGAARVMPRQPCVTDFAR